MRINRRAFVKTGATAAALTALPARAAMSDTALFVYDSRINASAARAAHFSGPKIDVAHMDAENWRSLRTALPQGRITGLTRWSDLVLVRGYGEEQGKRLKSERQRGSLFEWTMA
jgi:hypothetical protein